MLIGGASTISHFGFSPPPPLPCHHYYRLFKSKKNSVAPDIDGLLPQGVKVLSRAFSALTKLKHHKAPNLYLTNGGGTIEQVCARKIEKVTAVSVDGNQMSKVMRR